MGVTFVMTSNKILFFLIFFVSTSCETINEITGLGGKPDIDDSLAMETPDLVLPPDFGNEPRKSMIEEREIVSQSTYQPPQVTQPLSGYQAVYPRITNYYSPKLMFNLPQLHLIHSRGLSKIKSLQLVNGFTANMLMDLKEVIYIIDRFMIKVTIFLEGISLGVTSLPSRPHSLLKLLMITTHNHLSVEKMNQTSIHLINYQL